MALLRRQDRRAINVINYGHQRYAAVTHGQPAGQVNALAIAENPICK